MKELRRFHDEGNGGDREGRNEHLENEDDDWRIEEDESAGMNKGWKRDKSSMETGRYTD